MNSDSFTFESLNNLKFKKLRKLSMQYNVNKKWAKKVELINNLLALKNNAQVKEEEWRDSSSVFSNTNKENNDELDSNRRLTFNITNNQNKEIENAQLTFDIDSSKTLENIKESDVNLNIPVENIVLNSNKDIIDPRATFNIPKNCADSVKSDSRKTFYIPPRNSVPANKKISRETFYIPPRSSVTSNIRLSRETFSISQNGKDLLTETECANNEKISPVSTDLTHSTEPSTKRITRKKIDTKIQLMPCFKGIKRNVKNVEELKKHTVTTKNRTTLVKTQKPADQSLNKINQVNSIDSKNKISNLNSTRKALPEKTYTSKIPKKCLISRESTFVLQKGPTSLCSKENKITDIKSKLPRASFNSSLNVQKEILSKTQINGISPKRKIMAEKQPSRSDIREKNRHQINGVRTNKRFELQLKFRKL